MTTGARRRVSGVATGLAIGSLAAACSAVAPGMAATPEGVVIREQVVRIGEFANVQAIAVAPTRTFVVGEGGLATYDRGARRWLPPVSLGLATLASLGFDAPCAAATNLIGDAIWVACGTRVTVVRPAIGAVWTTELGRPVTALAVNRSGADAWAFVGGGAVVVSASGTARPLGPDETVPPDRIRARTVVGGDRLTPGGIADPLLTRDDALRVWPPSAVGRSETGTETWIGTRGGGVFLADVDFHRSQQLPFGLRSGAVRAVARTATGVIVAEDPTGSGYSRSLITTASDDLTTWEWPSLYTSLGAVSAVAAREGNLCVAGELGAGIASLTPLASSPTASLANDHRIFEPAYVAIAGRDGCIVGTSRGAVVLPWPGSAASDTVLSRSLGLTPPVRSLASSGDTTWIGTTSGLYRAVGTANAGLVRLPPSVGLDIFGLALTEDGIAIATSGEVWLSSGPGRTGTLARTPGAVARLGRLTALASDARTLWIGGTNGVMAIELSTGASSDVPLDDPASVAPPVLGGREVRAIALTDRVAWIGTAAGVVRVRRLPGGLPR